MKLRKTNMAPFWSMVVLLIFNIGFDLYLYFAYYKELFENFPNLSIWVLRYQFITTGILIAEVIIYFLIRKWNLVKWFIWIHIGCSYFVIVGIPVLGTALALLVFQDRVIEYETRVLAEGIRFIAFWSFVIIGHIFFAAAIISGFKNKRKNDDAGEVAQVFESI